MRIKLFSLCSTYNYVACEQAPKWGFEPTSFQGFTLKIGRIPTVSPPLPPNLQGERTGNEVGVIYLGACSQAYNFFEPPKETEFGCGSCKKSDRNNSKENNIDLKNREFRKIEGSNNGDSNVDFFGRSHTSRTMAVQGICDWRGPSTL